MLAELYFKCKGCQTVLYVMQCLFDGNRMDTACTCPQCNKVNTVKGDIEIRLAEDEN